MRPTAPNTLRAFSWAFAVTCALMSGVGAGNLDGMYDNQELAELQPRYERGWRNNYKEFFLPVFTAPERTGFLKSKFTSSHASGISSRWLFSRLATTFTRQPRH